MRKKINKGQHYVEFAVVVGLIAVFSVLTLALMGNNISTLFAVPSGEIRKFVPIDLKLQNIIKVLPGAPTKPAIQCNNNVCTSKWGVVTLDKLPIKFGTLVQTT